MIYDVAVIGGGASGMVAAIFAKRAGAKVLLIEATSRLGKKILATGNGKCNALPAVSDVQKYNSTFVSDILSTYDVQSVRDFFKSIGIVMCEDNGRLYPHSFQATSVQNALRNEIERLQITVALDTKIDKIQHNKCFELGSKDNTYFANKVVISIGTPAGFGLDSVDILSRFGISHKDFNPSLCPLITDRESIKGLRGVRTNVGIKLQTFGKEIFSCEDEILFKDNGISGTAVFKASVCLARKFGQKLGDISLFIDFAPDLTHAEVAEFVQNCLRNCLTLEGLAHKEIIKNVCERISGVSPKDIGAYSKKFANVFKEYAVKVLSFGSFELAQVASGGYLTAQFNPKTLEALEHKGIFATGECLDVDGECGGFNLHWAWASGMAAGTAAATEAKL